MSGLGGILYVRMEYVVSTTDGLDIKDSCIRYVSQRAVLSPFAPARRLCAAVTTIWQIARRLSFLLCIS